MRKKTTKIIILGLAVLVCAVAIVSAKYYAITTDVLNAFKRLN